MTKKLHISLALILSLAWVYAMPYGFMKDPAVSPDGSQICFVYQNDLWLVSYEGGNARRLTSTPASEWSPVWAPDGSRIAFNSNREGQGYIYSISPFGGDSRLLSRTPLSVVDWFSDSNTLLCTKYSFRNGTGFFRLDTSSGELALIAEIGDRFASISPDDSKIVFNRYGDPHREAYRGSLNGDLWELDIATGKYSRLTSTPSTERYPAHSYTQNAIYFCASDGQRFQLMRADRGNYSSATKLSDFPVWSTRDIKIARQNDRIVYELFNEIWSYDPARRSSDRIKKVDIIIPEDDWTSGRRTSFMNNEFSQFAVSDDELLIGFTYMYDVFAVPTKGGDTRRISDDLNSASNMLFLNDNRSILMQRLHNGQDRLFLAQVDSTMSIEPVDWWGADSLFVESLYRDASGKIIIHYRNSEKGGNLAVTDDSLTHFDKYEFPFVVSSNFAISPDMNWAAFASLRDDTWMREFYLYDMVAGELHKVFTDDQWIGNISWTKDLKSILMSRGRDLYRLDLVPRDELEFEKDHWAEILAATADAATPDSLDTALLAPDSTATSDSLASAGDADEATEDSPDATELAEEETVLEPLPAVEIIWEDLKRRFFPVLTGGSSYLSYLQAITDSTFYYLSNSYDRSSPSAVFKTNIYGQNTKKHADLGTDSYAFSLAGKSLYYLQDNRLKSVNLESSGRKEYSATFDYEYDINLLNRRVFEQVWGAFGLNFYDANMHGQDWDALYERYSPYLQNVRSMSDLATIVDEMIGDVNASHTGFRPRSEDESPYRSQAYLPLEYDYSQVLDEGLVVRTVYPGTRLSYLYKIPSGAILTHVNERAITAAEPLEYHLLDKAGQSLRLRFLIDGQSREAVINAIGWSQMRSLHYDYKVENTARQVEELTDGRIGYVHIPAMGAENYTDFYRDLFRDNADKDALIIDVRGNVGGRIHDMIISLLIKKPYGYSTSRRYSREQRIEPSRIWNKPSIVLVDEHSFSDGEIFPIIYQELKLGKVVGYPSSGAVIGTWEYELIDGSSMRMPSTGWYKLDHTNMEGTGAQPDIVIEHSPNDIIDGNDLQLKRAIEELQRELH